MLNTLRPCDHIPNYVTPFIYRYNINKAIFLIRVNQTCSVHDSIRYVQYLSSTKLTSSSSKLFESNERLLNNLNTTV